jgi:hypothetical protein
MKTTDSTQNRAGMDAADRISTLRAQCRQRKTQKWIDTVLVDHRSFQGSASIPSHPLQVAFRMQNEVILRTEYVTVNP